MARNQNQIKKASLPKLTPPRVGKIYPRERLFNLLDRLREDHRVVWISAPGGAGKTSLVASWLQARKLPTLWYQVDAGDGDIASFFYYLGQAAPPKAEPLPLLTPEYLGDVPTFTRNFFRALFGRLKPDSVLVLDNYQDAPEDSRLHDVLRVAMGEVPHGLTLLVLSRVEPPSVLARLRLCDHAACIDWPKLQLTAEESAGIGALRLGEHTLTPETIDTLHRRAHGWAAGLVLMLEQSRAGPISAAPATTDRQLIFDYFAGELLARCGTDEQHFLRRTALLPKFTAAMAQSLTGNARAQAILDDLTRRNYFTVRIGGGSEDSFEYHPLFRDFLRARAADGLTPDAYRQLQVHAARLLETAGHIEDAVALLQDARDWSGKGVLIAKHALAVVRGGRGSTLDQWISELPGEVVDAAPWLRYWWGVARLPRDPRGARVLLERAYEQFKAASDLVGQWYGFAAVIDSVAIEWGDFTPLDRWIAELDDILRAHPVFPSPEIEAMVSARVYMALMYRRPDHPDLGVWEARAWALATGEGDPEQRVFVGVHLLISYVWWLGLLPKAKQLLDILTPVAERREVSPLTRISFRVITAGYGWMVAENERAMAVAQAGLDYAAETGVHLWDVFLATQVAFAALSLGDVETTRAYLDRVLPQLDMHRYMDASVYYYTFGWLAWLDNDIVKAREHHEMAVDRALKSGIPFFVGAARIELALTMHRLGHADAARLLWQQARDCARTIRSYTLEYICALKSAEFALDRDDDAACVENMATMLRIAQERNILNHSHWRAPLMARLYCKALEHGVETEFVCRMIRLRKLHPPPGVAIPETWPYPLKLYTLGRFSVVRDGEPLRAGGKTQKKPLELLKALIAAGGRDVSAAQLMEWLWPQSEGDAASQSYHVTLKRLRDLIGEDALIQEGGRLTLNPDVCWVDVWALERTLSDLDVAVRNPQTDRLAAALTRVLALYHGPLLAAERDHAWALGAHERLRAKLLRCLHAAARNLADAGRTELAVTACEKALDIDPLAEPAYQDLMKLHLNSGSNAQALAVHERCCRALRAGLGISPSAETEAIAQRARGN
jgi:ATP/maltotriose-dependent transcriptional regulator MalT/DNA-binding SARP family transcriptional activator